MTTTWTQSSDSVYTDITGTNYIKGEMANTASSAFLSDTGLNDAQFYLTRTGTSATTVTCGIFDGSDSTLKHTFWTMDFNSLPLSGTLTSNTSTPMTSSLIETDVIGIMHQRTGSEICWIGYNTTDPFDGANSVYTGRDTDGSFPPITASDAAFSITGGAAPSSSTGTRLPPAPLIARF